MQKITHEYTSIEKEIRTHVATNVAAFYLNCQPQTLRAWACCEKGLLRPIRINGRLAWPVATIRALLQGGAI